MDFQRDHDVEKVWEAGGLSLLTSVPITPRVLCFLCASSGNVEVEYFLKGFLIDFYLYVLTFYLSFCSLSTAGYAVNHSISFAWGSQSALFRSSLRTGVVGGAGSARPVGASTRKLK